MIYNLMDEQIFPFEFLSILNKDQTIMETFDEI